jgi:hypothetical protein
MIVMIMMIYDYNDADDNSNDDNGKGDIDNNFNCFIKMLSNYRRWDLKKHGVHPTER